MESLFRKKYQAKSRSEISGEFGREKLFLSINTLHRKNIGARTLKYTVFGKSEQGLGLFSSEFYDGLKKTMKIMVLRDERIIIT